METFAAASILLYTLSITVLGARLLAMFLLRGAPTGLIGIGLLFGGAPVLALGLLFSCFETRPDTLLWQLARAGILISAGVACVCVMRFTHEVFRPHSRVLPWLIGGVSVYFAVAASTLPFAQPTAAIGGSWLDLGAFFSLLAIFTWTSAESFRYWRIYRQVAELEPFVVDRFRMWALAAMAIIFVIGLQLFARGYPFAQGLSGCFGLLCTVSLWLAFLPPRWYRRRLHGQARRERSDAGA